ncbi:histidine--tRNA ligase [Candidatus Dependentiae bacterium]|nr:histidine--tRNA ligase [Candidatus Dependentiae bacterium]
MYNRVKGTQDFLDLTLFNFLINEAKKHFALYNFTEISTPILEPLELFQRSLGSETDVVTKEMYTIVSEDEHKLCLRPEATASCVRAFVNNNINTTPWKIFLWGPMFRHERPQKGRYRQFHQINMEIIGAHSILQDAHFIKMLDRFFNESLKLDAYALHLNFVGCAEDRTAYKVLLREFLTDNASGSCSLCLIRKDKNILRVFDCKNSGCQDIYKSAPPITDSLCTVCTLEWRDLKDNLEHLSVSYSYTPTLVRGLDYYDKTVFEFVDVGLGAQNTFCGGGRYNSLVKQVGGHDDQPSLGASIGIERVLLLLENENHTEKLSLPAKPPLYVILPLSAAQQALALLLADELQAHSLAVEILLEGDSLKSMLRKANKMGARYALLVGQEEQEKKIVTVKDMVTGHEEKVAHRGLIEFFKTSAL